MVNLSWFDFFGIFLISILLFITFFFLLITIIAKIWSVIFIKFIHNLEKKGVRLTFIEYLNYDDIKEIE